MLEGRKEAHCCEVRSGYSFQDNLQRWSLKQRVYGDVCLGLRCVYLCKPCNLSPKEWKSFDWSATYYVVVWCLPRL